jgi:SOS response regulatory protein OraA/RecX
MLTRRIHSEKEVRDKLRKKKISAWNHRKSCSAALWNELA